ncbi:MAG: isocitrate lyase/PEP mutase family protein [Bryobacteraceae bacterium]|jgi:carboxyvinyl-carboxyphosphonate phosphorylmutase
MSDFLQGKRGKSDLLRKLIAGRETIVAPGAYDALTARIIAQAGFPAVYMTGFGTVASLLGRPDVGLLTMSEMVDNARRMAQAIDVPLIADADTGYGNPLNVIRTVKEYELAGVSAIHIEDQITPKKCGHMENKQVVSTSEMMEKILAAIEARISPDFLIIARTDARAVEGLDSALRRARKYREAGADVLFVEAPQSEQEVARVASELADAPLLFNFAEGGKTPPIPLDRLRELGYRIVIFPIGALLAAATAVRKLAAEIHAHGTPIALLSEMISFQEFNQMIGLSEIRQLERKFPSKTA